MPRINVDIRRAAPWAISALFLAGLLWFLFPGIYSPDSVVMIWAATGETPLTNWHPTILVRLWSVATVVGRSAAAVWVFQSVLAGICALMLLRAVRRPAAVATAAACLLLPPLWGALALTWKDTQLALIWWLVALSMVRTPASRRGAAILVFGVVAIASARYNSIGLAVAPAWLAASSLGNARELSNTTRLLKRGATTLIILVGALAFSLIVGSFGVEERFHPEEAVFTFDIVGVGVRTGEVELRPEAERVPPCTLADYASQYNPRTSDYLIFGPDACVNMGLLEDEDPSQHVFANDWLQTITSNPIPYLKHRTKVTLATLGISSVPPGSFIGVGAPTAESFLSSRDLSRPNSTAAFLNWFSTNMGFLYRPVLWILISLVALASTRKPRSRLTMVMAGTVLNEILVCMTTPAADVRYSYPALITMILLIVFAVESRGKNRDNTSNMLQ